MLWPFKLLIKWLITVYRWDRVSGLAADLLRQLIKRLFLLLEILPFSMLLVVILDNRITGMTGGQTNPGVPIDGMGNPAPQVSIEGITKGVGAGFVKTIDPVDLKKTEEIFKEALQFKGVAVVITKHPCAMITDTENRKKGINIKYAINQEECSKCLICVKNFTCPAIYIEKESLCPGMSKESDRGEKMKNIYKIQLIGVGGQGTIKASTIVGEAAMKKGLNVVMSEVHGMAQRGGTVVTELKIGEAHSPLIEEGAADLLIAFEPTEALRSLNKVGRDSFVIVNSAPIVPFTVSLGISEYPELSSVFEELKSKINSLIVIDAQKIAKEAGSIISENMVLLGAAVGTPEFPIDKDLIIQSMKENLPPKSIETNLKAFEMGFEEVKKGGKSIGI